MNDTNTQPDIILLQTQAIKVAKTREWDKAIETNHQILDLDSNNLPALKRLAHAYFSTQNYPASLKQYQKALKIDKNDSIAKTNISKLTHLADEKIHPCDPTNAENLANNFLKVNENAVSVQLIKITKKTIWHHISPGVPIEIIASRNGLTANLAQTGQYIGRVRQDSVSPSLCKKIIKGQYQAIIQCPDPKQIQILVKY